MAALRRRVHEHRGTGTTYVVRVGDRGLRVRLAVTVRNALGVSSAKSAQTSAVVSVQQVRTALVRAITVHGETIAKLLAHGHTSQVAALAPGHLNVRWMVGGTQIAGGGVTFAKAGSRTLHLTLTGAGKRLLGHARGQVTVTVQGTFGPAGGGASDHRAAEAPPRMRPGNVVNGNTSLDGCSASR